MGRCVFDKGRFSMKKIVLLVLSLCLVVVGCSKAEDAGSKQINEVVFVGETENNDLTQTTTDDSAKEENDNHLI